MKQSSFTGMNYARTAVEFHILTATWELSRGEVCPFSKSDCFECLSPYHIAV